MTSDAVASEDSSGTADDPELSLSPKLVEALRAVTEERMSDEEKEVDFVIDERISEEMEMVDSMIEEEISEEES